MATQHPDNASAPYWDKSGNPFVSVHQEITEAIHCFQDLDVGEYMWDWEGKHADAAVIDRLFSDYYEYFSKTQLGRDKFLTFRIPNIWEEKGYNLLQAMTVFLSGEDFARDLKMQGRPLFETILPMTERSDQLMHMHQLFEKLAKFKSTEFTTQHETNTDYLELIPLVESVESQLGVADLLEEYVAAHDQHFKRKPEYIRAFLACSDSSLSSGFLAGILGNKVALSRLHQFAERSGIPIFPIMGSGSLRFRGGLSPDTIDRFIQEFSGVRTVSVQSAFRYDYPKEQVIASIQRLEEELPKASPKVIDGNTQGILVDIARRSAEIYKTSLSSIAGSMQPVFKQVPKRRDRRQHIGLVSYSRSMGEHTLPRAITFTGAFYSIGIPPEFIGLGRSLKQISESDMETLKAEYPNLKADYEAAGRYLNKDNLNEFAKGSSGWDEIKTDVELAEEILGTSFGPQTDAEKEHQRLSSELIKTEDKAKGAELITKMGVLRKSLG